MPHHDLLATVNFARVLCSYLGLALFPEREVEAYGYMQEALRRFEESRSSRASIAWDDFEIMVSALGGEVTRLVHNPSWQQSLHRISANDDGSSGCETCAQPGRAAGSAMQVGRLLAHVLSAVDLGNAMTLKLGIEQFSADLDGGHVLPIDVLRHAFVRCAGELNVPKTATHRMIAAVGRIDRASTQLSFDFARAA